MTVSVSGLLVLVLLVVLKLTVELGYGEYLNFKQFNYFNLLVVVVVLDQNQIVL